MIFIDGFAPPKLKETMYKKIVLNYALYCKEKDMYAGASVYHHTSFQKHPFLVAKKATVHKWALRLLRSGIVTDIREFRLTTEETETEYTEDDYKIAKIRIIEKDLEQKYLRKQPTNIGTSIHLDGDDVFDFISKKYMVFLLYSSDVKPKIVKDYIENSFSRIKLYEVEVHSLKNVQHVYCFASNNLNKITILKLLKDEDCAFEIYDLEALKFL